MGERTQQPPSLWTLSLKKEDSSFDEVERYPANLRATATLERSNPQFLLLSMMLCVPEYPFGQLRSAVLAVSPPNLSPTLSLLIVEAAWKAEVLRLCKHCSAAAETLISGDDLRHLENPLPMLDHPFSKEIFPNTQSKPLLMQLEAISSHPIACYLGEETDPHLTTTSFQAKQPQLPQPLLIRLLLQTLHQLPCPSLDTLQHLNVPLVVRGPKLNTIFKVQPHQCRVQGDDHFPSPAAHAIFDTSQDAVGLLGHLGTLLAHVQPAIDQHSQVLLCQAAFQPLFPKPVPLHGVAVAQVQDPALGLVKPHTIDLSPSIQPVQVPL
ncbi:hypothetical protein QYF61_012788 [Mycteria americana]|uniref:Uncharacterized protein n=1 Tax=Mycteria americana TaxID=33587 RepID=A0AAN7RZR4_MYCAM|nr:hypothetical protein QYF61_012788 [Mycteria americana]